MPQALKIICSARNIEDVPPRIAAMVKMVRENIQSKSTPLTHIGTNNTDWDMKIRKILTGR